MGDKIKALLFLKDTDKNNPRITVLTAKLSDCDLNIVTEFPLHLAIV